MMQEVGHFLAAYPKNVKLGIPFFIPNFTLGTFGSITQVSVFNSRRSVIICIRLHLTGMYCAPAISLLYFKYLITNLLVCHDDEELGKILSS